MEEDDTGHNGLTEPDQVSKPAAKDAEPSQRIVRAFCECPAEEHGFQPPGPVVIGQAFKESEMLAVAHAFDDAHAFGRRAPEL